MWNEKTTQGLHNVELCKTAFTSYDCVLFNFYYRMLANYIILLLCIYVKLQGSHWIQCGLITPNSIPFVYVAVFVFTEYSLYVNCGGKTNYKIVVQQL